MSDDLQRKLGSWADQASPVTADEARARADADDLGAQGPGGVGGGGATGSRRLLGVAAAVVLVGAVAVGGWVIANDGDESPTGVDTVDQPTTTMSTDVGPSTTLDSGSSVPTTTFPDGTTVEPPKLIVVHGADHKLEVFDRTTGSTVRVLAEFDVLEAAGPNGEPAMMGRYLKSVVVSPDGQTVFYETCCEPAVGEVFRIPITGGEPEFVTYGTDPAISPDGTKLAVVEMQGLKVVDLTDGSERRFEQADVWQLGTLLANPSWSPDSSTLALNRYDDSLDFGRVILVTLDGSEGALQDAVTVALNDGAPMLPVFDADGNVVVIRQPQWPNPGGQVRAETYRIVSDTEEGGLTVYGDAMGSVELDGPVRSQRTAAGGRFLLRTFVDGTLRADLGDGDTLEILDPGYLAAAW